MRVLAIDFSKFPELSYITFDNGVLESIDNIVLEKTTLTDVNFPHNQIMKIAKLPRFPFKLRQLNL